MWQTKHCKSLFNFDTDTTNHLERFNRTPKDRISSKIHISECVKQLISLAEDIKAEEMNCKINLKQKIYNSNDSKLLIRSGSQIISKAIELWRQQNNELKFKHYFIEEIEDNRWKIGQKDEEKKHFITSSTIYRDSYEALLICDCQFYLQNQLPYRHMIVLVNKINDEIYHQTYEIQQIISLNKRGLKTSVNQYFLIKSMIMMIYKVITRGFQSLKLHLKKIKF